MKLSFANLNHYYSRFLQEMAFRTGGSFGKPTGVIVLFTNRCNARCIHCYSWKLNSEDSEMTTHEWKRTFDELRRWLGPIFISITGGETLLRKDSVQLATHASHLGFWVEFLTNGYLITPDLAWKLVQSGVKRIKVSLDGSQPDIHDRIRGREGFFSSAVEALRMLAKEKNKHGINLKIWAKTTVMSLNINDLPNIVKLVSQLGIDGVEFQALEPIYYSEQLRNPKWYENNPLWINNLTELSKVIQKLKEEKKRGAPIINTLDNLDLIENYFNNPKRFSFKVHSHEYYKKTPKCRAWIGGLQIMPDGGMKMCHWMNAFANAKNGNLKDAWQKRNQCWKKLCHYIDISAS